MGFVSDPGLTFLEMEKESGRVVKRGERFIQHGHIGEKKNKRVQ